MGNGWEWVGVPNLCAPSRGIPGKGPFVFATCPFHTKLFCWVFVSQQNLIVYLYCIFVYNEKGPTPEREQTVH